MGGGCWNVKHGHFKAICPVCNKTERTGERWVMAMTEVAEKSRSEEKRGMMGLEEGGR